VAQILRGKMLTKSCCGIEMGMLNSVDFASNYGGILDMFKSGEFFLGEGKKGENFGYVVDS